MPSGKQIATAGGDTSWTESFETTTKLPTWLYSHTKFTTEVVVTTASYWTTSHFSDYHNVAWYMQYDGTLTTSGDIAGQRDYYGIRPVIIIPKSQLG